MSAYTAIQPALTFRPLSPFLAMLIEQATLRSERPEELAPASVSEPRRIAADAPPRLDLTV